MHILKDKRGGGYVTPCVITLVIAMILSAVLFYAECMTIIQTTVENTERVLESFIMKNSIEIYQSIKQGHDFTEDFDENYYICPDKGDSTLDDVCFKGSEKECDEFFQKHFINDIDKE